jgi:hypothetical protein
MQSTAFSTKEVSKYAYPFFIGSSYNIYFNNTEHSIAEFLEKLNYEAALTPLLEMESAIEARKFIKNPKAQAGALCASIICDLATKQNAEETAVALTEFWKIVPEFEQYVHLQAVETRISRVLLMHSSSKAYSWVVLIATEAINLPTAETWVSRLAKDIKHEWRKRYLDDLHPDSPQEAIFNSKDYLPSLTPSREAVLKLGRWMSKCEQQERLIHFLSYIIETWLHFPNSTHTNNSFKVRCALITIMTKHMPFSVLFLDDVWKMYNRPYAYVIHGRPREGDRQRVSHSHTEQTLILFEQSIQNHVMADLNSNEHLLLMVLNKYSENWFQLTTSRKQRENQVTLQNSNVRIFFVV